MEASEVKEVKVPPHVCKSWVLSKTCIRDQCTKEHPDEEERVRLAALFAAKRHANRLSRRTALPPPPSGVSALPVHSDDRSHRTSRARVFTQFLIETFGRELLMQGSGVLDVAGGSGYVSACLATLGIRSTLIDPKHRNHAPKQQFRKLRKVWGPFYSEQQRLERVKAGKKADDAKCDEWWLGEDPSSASHKQSERLPPLLHQSDLPMCACSSVTLHTASSSSSPTSIASTSETPLSSIPSSLLSASMSTPIPSETKSLSSCSSSSISLSSLPQASPWFSANSGALLDRSLFCPSPSFHHCICPFAPSVMCDTKNEAIVEVNPSTVRVVTPSASLSYRSLLTDSSVVAGLHPDQATEAIVDFAVSHNKPFAIVPCCVFGEEFPDRRGPQGEMVSSYDDFVRYLLLKAGPRAQAAMLPLEGKCLVIYRLPG